MKEDFVSPASQLAFRLFWQTGEIGAFMLHWDLENLTLTQNFEDELER